MEKTQSKEKYTKRYFARWIFLFVYLFTYPSGELCNNGASYHIGICFTIKECFQIILHLWRCLIIQHLYQLFHIRPKLNYNSERPPQPRCSHLKWCRHLLLHFPPLYLCFLRFLFLLPLWNGGPPIAHCTQDSEGNERIPCVQSLSANVTTVWLRKIRTFSSGIP